MATKKLGWKYPQGRTIRQAVDAGDYFRLVNPTSGYVEMDSPGCGTPEECLRALRMRHPVAPGETFTVERYLPGSSIGCAIVEVTGTITA